VFQPVSLLVMVAAVKGERAAGTFFGGWLTTNQTFFGVEQTSG